MFELYTIQLLPRCSFDLCNVHTISLVSIFLRNPLHIYCNHFNGHATSQQRFVRGFIDTSGHKKP